MSETEKKSTFRDCYRNFVLSQTGREYHQLENDTLRSFYLLKCYINEVHNRIRTYISPEDFERGYVDASNDAGVDFIHRDDGHVILIQSKFAHRKGTPVRPADMSHFQQCLCRLTDDSIQANNKLADALSEVDFGSDTFTLIFLTLAKNDGASLSISRQGATIPGGYDDLGDRVTLEVLDDSLLNEELRTALSTSREIPTECLIRPQKSNRQSSDILEIESGSHRSFILVVPASQIVSLWQQFKDSLFTMNIRNYIGATRTNKAIIDTALTQPDDFFFFNNGISCLARSVSVSDERDCLTAQGLQVVNGAQTVRSLARAAQKKPQKSLVLLRITEIPNGYSSERPFLNSVIRYNNTQNVIKASDFRSNDQVQSDLQRKFEHYKRYGRQVQYLAKRSERSSPHAIVIRLEEFAKTIYSFLRDPVAFAGGTSFLFDESERGGYIHVFGNGQEVWEIVPDEEFRLRSAIWWISSEYSGRLAVERKSLDTNARIALDRRWMLLFAARLLLERNFGDGYREILQRRYQGDWKLGEGRDGKWFESIYEMAKDTVIYVYEQCVENKDVPPRLWWRSQTTVDRLKNFVMKSPMAKIQAP